MNNLPKHVCFTLYLLSGIFGFAHHALCQNAEQDRFVLIDVASCQQSAHKRLTFRDEIDSSVTHVALDIKPGAMPKQGLEFARSLLNDNQFRTTALTNSRLIDWKSSFVLHLAVTCNKLENGTIEVSVLPTFSKNNLRCGAASPEIWHLDGEALRKVSVCTGWYLLVI